MLFLNFQIFERGTRCRGLVSSGLSDQQRHDELVAAPALMGFGVPLHPLPVIAGEHQEEIDIRTAW